MLTPKQNLLETLKHRDGHPACLLNSYTTKGNKPLSERHE